MKSLIYILIWTTLFVLFGFYVNSEINKFTDNYTSRIDTIETCINYEDWETAKYQLNNYIKDFQKEKDTWYKLLNHDYFDNIYLSLNLLNKSIYLKDKSISIENIEKIKYTLDNILDSQNYDLNHIF